MVALEDRGVPDTTMSPVADFGAIISVTVRKESIFAG